MDDRDAVVPGAVDVRRVLRTDPIYAVLGRRFRSPLVLGLVLAALALIAIVFGPASDSRFIYTDF